jgi:uncharacterized protein
MAQIARAPFQVMAKPIGAVCNLRCAYCFYLDKLGLYPPGEHFKMADDVLGEFVRQYMESQPGPAVTFAWQGGEPTMTGLGFFRRVVELQKRHLPKGWECSNALQTNGLLLDREWCEFLRDNRFLVGISIDGPQELHDRYRLDSRGEGTHGRVMAALALLQEHRVDCNALCVVNDVNVGAPLDVYRFLREAGLDWIQFIPLVEPLADGVSERTVSSHGFGSFLCAIFEEWIAHDVGRMHVQAFEECLFVWSGLRPNLCVQAETCGLGLVMEHNGDIYSCDHFVDRGHFLGNILRTSLAELACDHRQSRFGLEKRDGLPSCCRVCDVRFICNGGCPKDRIALSPEGEPNLNYLCAGYRMFFRHARPFAERMTQMLKQGMSKTAIMHQVALHERSRWENVGRNELCPCGSGRKYKHCCLAARSS